MNTDNKTFDADLIPDTVKGIAVYIAQCLEDLNKYTSEVSQETINETLQRAKYKLMTL